MNYFTDVDRYFLSDEVSILITSIEEARKVYRYYDENYDVRHNSSNEKNCLRFPYLCCDSKRIHGNTKVKYNHPHRCVDEGYVTYYDWATEVGIIEDKEVKESEKPLSFLFE